MIVLVGGQDEKRIAGSDAIVGQAGEEFVKCLIIRSQLLDVGSFAGTKGAERGDMAFVGIRDVSVGDRDVVLLHRCGVGEGLRRGNTAEAREAVNRMLFKSGRVVVPSGLMCGTTCL